MNEYITVNEIISVMTSYQKVKQNFEYIEKKKKYLQNIPLTEYSTPQEKSIHLFLTSILPNLPIEVLVNFHAMSLLLQTFKVSENMTVLYNIDDKENCKMQE